MNPHDGSSSSDGEELEVPPEQEQARLLRRRFVLAHRRKKHVRKKLVESEKIEARDFAILLLQQMAGSLGRFYEDFQVASDRATKLLGQEAFMRLLQNQLAVFIGTKKEVVETYGQEKQQTSTPTTIATTNASTKAMQQAAQQALVRSRAAEDAWHIMFRCIKNSVGTTKSGVVPHQFLDGVLEEMGGKAVEQSKYFSTYEGLKLSLHYLFKAIDHHNRNAISWDEFFSFLIDATMKGRVGKEKLHTIFNYVCLQYEPTSIFEGIREMKYLPEVDKLFLATSKEIKMVAPTLQFQPTVTCGIVGSGRFLAGEFIVSLKLIVATTSDHHLHVFDGYTAKLIGSAGCSNSQTLLQWHENTRTLFSADRSGLVTTWEINASDQFRPKFKHEVKCHTGPVTAMLTLPADGGLVTASLDSTVVLLEPKNGKILFRYSAHRAGILSLAFCSYMDYNFLISAGFEYEPYVWLVNSSEYRPFRLHDSVRPHSGGIIHCQCVADTPQVITGDANGTIKIWDIQTLSCVQTLSCMNEPPNMQHINTKWKTYAYIPTAHRIIAASRAKVWTWEYNQAERKHRSCAATTPIHAVLYNLATKSFVTSNETNVRKWDAVTGSLLEEFKEIVSSDISCMCLDPDGRKLFVGCMDGSVSSHNFSNGSLVSAWNCATSAIQSLYYCQGRNYVVCSSTEDGATILLDSDDPYSPNIHKLAADAVKRPRCADFSNSMSLFLIGDSRNIITVWSCSKDKERHWTIHTRFNNNVPHNHHNYLPHAHAPPDTGEEDTHNNKVMGKINKQTQKAEASAIAVLHGYPVCVVADSNGNLQMWSISPHFPYKFQVLARWETIRAKRGWLPTIGNVHWLPEHAALYCSDEIGRVIIFDLNPIFKYYGMMYNNTDYDPMMPLPQADMHDVPVLHQWKAHDDTISMMKMINNRLLVTASWDCTVKMWTLSGKAVGCLDQYGHASYKLSLAGHSNDIIEDFLKLYHHDRHTDLVNGEAITTELNCFLTQQPDSEHKDKDKGTKDHDDTLPLPPDGLPPTSLNGSLLNTTVSTMKTSVSIYEEDQKSERDTLKTPKTREYMLNTISSEVTYSDAILSILDDPNDTFYWDSKPNTPVLKMRTPKHTPPPSAPPKSTKLAESSKNHNHTKAKQSPFNNLRDRRASLAPKAIEVVLSYEESGEYDEDGQRMYKPYTTTTKTTELNDIELKFQPDNDNHDDIQERQEFAKRRMSTVSAHTEATTATTTTMSEESGADRVMQNKCKVPMTTKFISSVVFPNDNHRDHCTASKHRRRVMTLQGKEQQADKYRYAADKLSYLMTKIMKSVKYIGNPSKPLMVSQLSDVEEEANDNPTGGTPLETNYVHIYNRKPNVALDHLLQHINNIIYETNLKSQLPQQHHYHEHGDEHAPSVEHVTGDEQEQVAVERAAEEEAEQHGEGDGHEEGEQHGEGDQHEEEEGHVEEQGHTEESASQVVPIPTNVDGQDEDEERRYARNVLERITLKNIGLLVERPKVKAPLHFHLMNGKWVTSILQVEDEQQHQQEGGATDENFMDEPQSTQTYPIHLLRSSHEGGKQATTPTAEQPSIPNNLPKSENVHRNTGPLSFTDLNTQGGQHLLSQRSNISSNTNVSRKSSGLISSVTSTTSASILPAIRKERKMIQKEVHSLITSVQTKKNRYYRSLINRDHNLATHRLEDALLWYHTSEHIISGLDIPVAAVPTLPTVLASALVQPPPSDSKNTKVPKKSELATITPSQSYSPASQHTQNKSPTNKRFNTTNASVVTAHSLSEVKKRTVIEAVNNLRQFHQAEVRQKKRDLKRNESPATTKDFHKLKPPVTRGNKQRLQDRQQEYTAITKAYR